MAMACFGLIVLQITLLANKLIISGIELRITILILLMSMSQELDFFQAKNNFVDRSLPDR